MLILLIALVVAAVISVAALVDPFSWMPPIGEIFGDCPDTAEGECDLGKRYPGFWLHVIVNFAYTVVALGLVAAFALAVPEFRTARSGRFRDDAAVEQYVRARQKITLVALLLAVLAASPILAALV